MSIRKEKGIFNLLAVFLAAAFFARSAVIINGQENKPLHQSEELARLSAEDKTQLTEILRLKKSSGNLVWPGFGEAVIPLIQYNERYSFLILHPAPPSSWMVVENDIFLGRPYYCRPAEEAEAFAVPVGDLWAGGLDTLSLMNRSMEEQIKEQVPPEKLTPAFLKIMAISPAHHVVALLHEAFHAFQAMQAPGRFQTANSVYVLEKKYPFEDEDFLGGWNREGELLAAALRAGDEAGRKERIREFLETRKERRLRASLSPELTAFERELEWLEGLAKYAELMFAELGSSVKDEELSKAYRLVWNRLRADFFSRLKKLGVQRGDLRFYLSGAALALLLDKTSPGWKRDFIYQKGVALEDLL